MFESVECSSSARLESETLTTVASIWEMNAPSTATDETFQRSELVCAASGCASVDAIGLLRGIATVKTTEVTGAEQADRQKAQPQSGHIDRGMQVEVSDTADQDVGDGEVEKAPEHVDGRRGKPFTARSRERALKG